jgi:hypothetical protein
MQHLPGSRALALVAGLMLAASGSVFAQDTTETGQANIDTMAPEPGAIDTAGVDTTVTGTDTSTTRDTTDTSGVQNPPGYRGMERDTTIFPDSGGTPATPSQAEDQTTGTYEDSAWQDKPAGDTTAGAKDTTSVGDTEPAVEDSATSRIDPSASPGGDTTGQAADTTPY